MMLIDFSEILQTNVYVLGQTVMSVRSKLATELPVIDPVHYIERFAARLSLGAKTQMVCNTAMQVVRRLSRDWLQTGRRPSGITGVALYIAAHMHGLNPSMADLVKEMHICDSTLRKRLASFSTRPLPNCHAPTLRLSPSKSLTMCCRQS
jgi:transcription factor IIIB subunit 2